MATPSIQACCLAIEPCTLQATDTEANRSPRRATLHGMRMLRTLTQHQAFEFPTHAGSGVRIIQFFLLLIAWFSFRHNTTPCNSKRFLCFYTALVGATDFGGLLVLALNW
jgi:hypothetical protein